ncbi:MAG: 3-keto-disaccharide hydrolase [Chthoniobacteraceae bacterium]
MRTFLSLVIALLPIGAFAQSLNTLSPQEKAQGWQLLFDGKVPIGFRGLQKSNFMQAGWTVLDDALTLTKTIDQSGKQTGGDLVTAQAYSDFEFVFEWKLPVSSDGGILYLARGGLGQKPTGMEFQLVDDVRNPESLKGGPIRRTGALDGILPPSSDKQINDNAWNHGKIVIQRNHVEHWINGSQVLAYDLGSRELMDAIKASGQKQMPGFGFKVKSPLVILDQGEEIALRNLKIRPIAPPPGPPRTSPGRGVMRSTGTMR